MVCLLGKELEWFGQGANSLVWARQNKMCSTSPVIKLKLIVSTTK